MPPNRNYLRVRGEYHREHDDEESFLELPPRARRILLTCGEAIAPVGTTSACAENTWFIGGGIGTRGNYLRVRGEYLDTAQAMAKHVELPPRARRILPHPFNSVA